MNILIFFRDRSPCERLAVFARRSLEFALDRFSQRIADVSLRVSDENGPRGGVDQTCSLAVKLVGGNDLHFHGIDSSPERCVHRLARKAASALARTIGKTRTSVRKKAIRTTRSK